MNRNTVIIIAGALLLLVGALLLLPKFFPSSPAERTGSIVPSAPEEIYTCPMHPSVRSTKPGACPICGMTLVKVSTDHADRGAGTGRSVSLSPERQVLAHVATTKAVRAVLEGEIRAAGKISYAEPNLRQITARFPGRVERLYLTFPGQQVRIGDPVADVYSPEAISAQREYLVARSSYEEAKAGPESIASGALALVEESRRKLVLWGFTAQQFSRLDSAADVQDTLTVYAPVEGTVLRKMIDPQHYVTGGEMMYEIADLSTVWLTAEIYEYETPEVKIGQPVSATSLSYPGRVFTGTITFLSPEVDPSTRTVRLRAVLPNPRGELRVSMFVDVSIHVRHASAIVVPASALLATGQRQLVWVQINDGVFEPREVIVGAVSASQAQILRGVDEGELVVTSGGYLIDSESQLQSDDAP